MKPPPFEFFDPTTAAEAVSLLGQYGGEAKVIAGGQSLVPLLNMRLARPGVLVDINRVAELGYIREVDGALAIGAIARHRAVERSTAVQKLQPLLHAAVCHIAHPQIRNRGTIGGSIAHADPAAELPAACVALGAELRITGPSGERTVKAEDFFITFLTTALGPDELLTEVRLPALPARTGWSFKEVSRRHGDFALAGAAVTLTTDGGACSDARIALFGVGSTPLRAGQAEQVLKGERPSDSLFEQAAQKASQEIGEPLSDIHASSEFRRHIAMTLTRQALAEAASRAQAL